MRRQFQHQPEEARKKALIAATLDSVADLGLSGTTVREVADRADVTAGLIRRYFDNKDNLICEAYRRFNETIVEMMIAQIDRTASAEDRLKQWIKACCTAPLTSKRNIAIWASFIKTANTSSAMATVHRDGYRAYRKTLEDILTDLWRENETILPIGTIETQAIVANAVLDGFWLEISLDADTFKNTDPVRTATSAIFAAIGYQPKTPLQAEATK